MKINDLKIKPAIITGSMFVKYFTCPHWLWFDRFGDKEKRSEPSSFHEMLLERGLLHEEKMIEELEYVAVAGGSKEDRLAQTRQLMADGEALIYHGLIESDDLLGEPDLLERVEGKNSEFGNYHYVPIDIKSAERVSEGMRMQLSFYADILARVQGVKPRFGYVLNGSGQRIGVELSESRDLYERVRDEIRGVLAGKMPEPRLSSGCRQSPWFSECIALAEETHDVTLLYNVKTVTLVKLRNLGVRTVEDAATMDIDEIHRLDSSLKRKTLNRARLQAQALVDQTHLFRKSVSLPKPELELFFDKATPFAPAITYLVFWCAMRTVKAMSISWQSRPKERKKCGANFWIGLPPCRTITPCIISALLRRPGWPLLRLDMAARRLSGRFARG
jgi:uncharacterized protein